MAAQPRRTVPGGVAFVAILALAIGVVEVIGGLIMLIFNSDVDGYSATGAVVFGIVTLIVGAIYVWVGRGLLRLNPTALFIGLFVSGLRLVYDVVWLIIFGIDGIGFTGIITLVINAAVFAALWSGRGAFTPPAAPAQSAT